jgi:hypothetical protein
MTREEIDLIYAITIRIHEDEWFANEKGKRGFPPKRRDREEVQEWVAQQLGIAGIYTVPVGCSWGVLVDKEYFDKYWKEHSKLKEEN